MICVWWIGEAPADEAWLEQVRAHAADEFGVPGIVWDSEDRPSGTFDPRRGQHSSRDMLRWLVDNRPPHSLRVVGVTDADLFMPVLTFVFGEAQLGGVAAVISTARLVDRANPARTLSRLVTEAVHELGHTFGLTHCWLPECVMSRSTNVQAVDLKRPHLCEDCRAKVRAALQDGLHV